MSNVRLENVYKIYPNGVNAVKDFNLNIENEEFIVFVGPSGCGKSTTLRMIAGLEDISAGRVYIDDQLVNDMEPKDRDISMVFQNYALYPNMTVYDNMAYGLRCQKFEPEEVKYKEIEKKNGKIIKKRIPNSTLKEKEIKEKIMNAAEILGITEYLNRKPKELSGGQRQRVALGRAIVRNPKVFLLDEPLSNLDAKLRVQMRSEITKLHERLGTTFIYVTHDQIEAMTMGTRIVVMKDGVIQQVDTPLNLYEHPENTFVATFLGSPQMNLFEGVVKNEGNNTYFIKDDLKILIPETELLQTGPLPDDLEIYLGLRPKDIHLAKEGYKTKIELTEQLGSETILYLTLPGKKEYSTISISDTSILFRNGQEIFVDFDTEKLHLFDKETGESLKKVNVCNTITSNIERKNDGLYLENLKLDKEYLDHILTDYKGEIELHIPSDKVYLDEKIDSISFDATIDRIVKYTTYSVAFATLKNNEKIVFKLNKEITDKEIKIYIPIDSIEIHAKEEKIYSRLLTKDSKVSFATYKKTKTSVILSLENKKRLKNKLFKVVDRELVNDKLILKLTGTKNVIKSGEAYKESITLAIENKDIFEGQFVFVK